MNVLNDNTAPESQDGWRSSPRRGMQRLIVPWEYRHLLGSGIARIVAGAVAAIGGAVWLASGGGGWGIFLLALGVLNIVGGYWYITISRSAAHSAAIQTSSPSAAPSSPSTR